MTRSNFNKPADKHGSNSMKPAQPSEVQVVAYYRAALAALRYLDRTRRRFGPDADALWGRFATGGGNYHQILRLSDRIDLLLRDADVDWSGAFSAREVFALNEVPKDDAFGMQWPGMPKGWDVQVWEEEKPESLADLLAFVAAAWGAELDMPPLPDLQPHTRVAVRGAPAIAALAAAFESLPGRIGWNEQVAVIATGPLERQLALLAGGAFRSATRFVETPPGGYLDFAGGAVHVSPVMEMKVIAPAVAPPEPTCCGEIGNAPCFTPARPTWASEPTIVVTSTEVRHPWGGRVVLKGEDGGWKLHPAVGCEEPGTEIGSCCNVRKKARAEAEFILLYLTEGWNRSRMFYQLANIALGLVNEPEMCATISEFDTEAGWWCGVGT